MRNGTPSMTVLAAIVALIFIGAALVALGEGAPNGSVEHVLGWISIVIVALVSSFQTERLRNEIKNGELEKNIKPAVKQALNEHADEATWDGIERRES